MIKQWLKKRRENRARKLYNRGFDYAAGALLRGEKTPIELQAESCPEDRDEFDIGVDHAINKLLNLIEDNRI